MGLVHMAAHLFVGTLPAVSFSPMLAGFAASIAMMLAVVMPHVWQMRLHSAMNILRRETIMQPMSAKLKFFPAAAVMTVMVFWQAQDTKLAISTMLAMLLMCGVLLVITYVLLQVAKLLINQHTRSKLLGTLVVGVQGLKTRFGLSAMQMLGFSMGLSVLLLLSLVRSDLMRNWQASLPADAPNRFAINIQPDQIAAIEQFFDQQHIQDTLVLPMVKGRLLNINQTAVQLERWKNERAKHLAEREFNLSWASEMQSDNKLVAGKWWQPEDQGKPYLSLEQDLANTLGIKLGDTLTFDVAGNPLTLTVTSLRKVDWDTMRANFFAVTPPGVLEHYPASYITSFHLPLGAEMSLNQLVKQFPNLTVIDVAALMEQVRSIMQRMSATVEYVFIFSLFAGLAVLYAALVATREERVTEATLMRVFGASRRQVSIAYITEFFCIGLIAAFLATLAANVLAYYVSTQVMEISFQFNLSHALVTLVLSSAAIPLAAWLGLRSFLNVPPRQLLNSI
jgi:putative ABC transport system permease protein